MPETQDEALNLAIRRFLKSFGVAAQRAIERAAESGSGPRTLRLHAVLEIDGKQSHVEDAQVPLT